MAVKNFTMKSRNASGAWDELYPKTIHDQVITDTSAQFVTATEKTTWNNKQNALGYTPINKAGDTMTGALTLSADPTLALQAATKQYVDSVAQGLSSKTEVRAATTTNISLAGTQTVDGVVLVAGDAILVKNQTAPGENGIYIVASGAWPRSPQYDTIQKLSSAFVFVQQGSTNSDEGWVCTADDTDVLGTSSILFSQFSGAGSVYLTQGTGITVSQSGNQFTVTHNDTSSQATSTNSGGTVIQSVGLDGMGHVTSLGTKSLVASDVGAVPTTDVVTTATASKILKLDSNSKLPASITGNADGNAATASKLATPRTIALTGEISGTATAFDGSANISIATTLPNVVTAGTATKITYSATGRVTAGNRATPVDVGITVSVTASPPTTPVEGDLWFEITG